MLAELCHQGGALVLQPGARHKGRRSSDDDREEQEDDALAIHDTAPSCSRCIKRRDDPQAAGSDCRAIGQAAAQPRANGAVSRGRRGADRRTGKDCKTERAARQGVTTRKSTKCADPANKLAAASSFTSPPPRTPAAKPAAPMANTARLQRDRHAERGRRQLAERDTGMPPRRRTPRPLPATGGWRS